MIPGKIPRPAGAGMHWGKCGLAVENRIKVNITVFKPDVSNIKNGLLLCINF